MSVKKSQCEGEVARHLVTVLDGDVCFYCGRSFHSHHRSVYWMGATASVDLHPSCAIRLGAHLQKDALAADVNVFDQGFRE